MRAVSLADNVALIKRDLALDPELKASDAVDEACLQLGLKSSGSLVEQTDAVLRELKRSAEDAVGMANVAPPPAVERFSESDLGMLRKVCLYFNILAIAACFIFAPQFTWSYLFGNPTGKMAMRLRDHNLEHTVKTPRSYIGSMSGGSNGPEKSWVVFYSKPSAELSVSMQPLVNVLANATAESVRFGWLDCDDLSDTCQTDGTAAPALALFRTDETAHPDERWIGDEEAAFVRKLASLLNAPESYSGTLQLEAQVGLVNEMITWLKGHGIDAHLSAPLEILLHGHPEKDEM